MTPSPGEPEIRPHRLPRRRTPLLIAAAATLVVGLAAAPALAQEEPVPAGAPDLTVPQPATAAPGTYSSPKWLPLRRDLPGSEVTVGCTLDSHGSQHGYECSGHHDRWAIDFIADTGTPVYAAGAGFATNLTGKPGGSGFGNVVSIDHGFGITTLYAHLSEVSIPAEGTWVDQNTLLGKVGQTGSASTPHLHFEEFAGPGGSNSTDPQSIDPGPLFGCRGNLLVSFPQVAGFDSWAGLPWGSLTVASDGDACITDSTPAAAAPNDLVPDDGSTDADDADDADDATEASSTSASTGSTSASADEVDTAWTDSLAALLAMVASTGDRLDLPG